ncbi:MAG: MDR family oxidoreductase [Terriglobales bacterium]
MAETFRALIAEGNSKQYTVEFKDLLKSSLPAGDVLVEVEYSSLNYKDGLAISKRGKVIRKFPMVCGIDLAGRVLQSTREEFRPGDKVVIAGQGLGETIWGGYSTLARVPADTLVHIPDQLSAKQAMAIGTAGFTAMLALMALEHKGLTPGDREVVVTGAAGGVGSIAVALLASRGYKVAASTGRSALHSWLRDLGATTIVDRNELAQKAPPLGSERWAGAIDNVGGETLATLLATTASYGSVASCGLAGGAEFSTTVFPFILRNVSLLGINSVQAPKPLRLEAWRKLASELPMAKLDAITTVQPLSNIKNLSEQIMAGQTRGRVVLDVNA